MKVTKKIEKEISTVIEDYWDSYLRGDLQTWASYLPDDYRNIGTTRVEIWDNKREIVEFTEKMVGQTANMVETRNKKMQIIPYAPYFMVHEVGDIYIKAEEGWVYYQQIRLSSLLEKTIDGWKIFHQHGSYPDSKTDTGEAFGFDELKAENKNLKDAIQSRTIELELKNRELKIEAALERVRAQTMAMHNSEDVGKCIVKMFGEVTALGVDEGTRFGIGILNHENENNQLWTASKDGEEVKMIIGNLDMTLHPLLKSARKVWKEQAPLHEYILTGEDLLNYYQALNDAPDYKYQIDLEKLPEKEFHYGFVFNHGFFYAFSPCKIQADLISIVQRFSSLFGQTYRRYLDLVTAEQQAREAQIEAALERVRAKAMSMHDSDELDEVLSVLCDQFDVLGILPMSTHMTVFDFENNTFTFRETGKHGNRSFGEQTVALDAMDNWKETVDKWKADEASAINKLHFPKEQLPTVWEVFHESFASMPEESRITPTDYPDGIYHTAGKHPFGYIGMNQIRPATAEEEQIVIKFANEFGRAYQRFLDLQKAEAQAREAQIEAALERIRSRTMTMQHPDELEEVVTIVVEKLMDLGIVLDANGVIICTYFKDSKDVVHWMASPDFTFSGRYLLPYFDHPIFNDAWNSRLNGDEYFSKAFSVEAKNSFFEYAFEYSDYKHFPDEFKEWIFQNDKHSLSFAWSKNSAILIPSHTGVVPDETDIEILKRFAKVFEQAYIRFMDLQVKEEQAVKLLEEKQRLEETLRDLQLTQKQLIQSEKMASLGELTAGIAHEIQNPLNFVNNFSEVSSELLEEMNEEIENGDLDEVKSISHDVKLNLQKINHHGKRADAIVKGMLQHSRKSTGKKTPTDINKLADEYLRLAYHGLRAKDKSFNATLNTDFDPDLEKVMLIPQDMGRVILNLITNAFYACAERSRSAGREKKNNNGTLPYQPTVNLSTKKRKEHIIITVEDNGNGIPRSVIDKIFQPFFTTKPTGQGTGLGLSLSYDIVKAHGGELEVETEEGKSTLFKIILPN